MTSDRIDELIALAALGELTPDDERELDEAARNDEAIAGELSEALAGAAAIQRSAPEDPPPGLRDSVLAAIRDTPQEGSGARPGPGEIDHPAVVVPITGARSRRWLPLLAGVAAAAVLFVGGIVVVSQNDSGSGDGDVAAVIEAPDAVTQVLAGELGGALSVTYSEAEDAVVVEGTDVPTIGDTETYQLWLVGDEGCDVRGSVPPCGRRLGARTPRRCRSDRRSCSASPRNRPAEANRRLCRSSPRPDHLCHTRSS